MFERTDAIQDTSATLLSGGLLTPEDELQRISEHLADRFKGVFAAQTVERYVFESYTALARTAKIKSFLVTMTETFARDRLIALAQSDGSITKTMPEILFVCVHNAGRSQMAMAILQQKAGDRVHVRSAGSEPGTEINPAVVRVLEEVGLDMTGHFPKPLTDDVVRAADYVITMGCGDACPVYPGKHYMDWELTDPANQGDDAVREIRDDITRRIDDLLATIESQGQ